MKNYTPSLPIFSPSILVVEVSDPAHADNVNAAPKQLLQNDLVLYAALDPALIDAAFYAVFPHLGGEPESESLTPQEITKALLTPWDGRSSDDPTAMSATQVDTAINTEWHGESSSDPNALDSEEIEESIAMGEELAGH